MTFFKYEQIPFEVVIVAPNPPAGLNGFSRVNITNLGLKIAINDSLDDATPLAEQASWTKDTNTNIFSGTLNLNTAAMTSYVGSSDKTPFFFVLIYDGTNWVPILQETCNVLVGTLQQTTTSPDPSRVYLDFDESMGVFVPRVMGAGESIIIPSPNGQYRRIIGCNDDGTARDDIEEV